MAKSPRRRILGPTLGTPPRALAGVGEMSGRHPGSPVVPVTHRPACLGLEGACTCERAPGLMAGS